MAPPPRALLAVCAAPSCSAAAWREMTASAAWPARAGMSTVVLNGSQLCLIGGKNGFVSAKYDDVWCSADQGSSWRQAPAFPGGWRSNGRLEELHGEVLHIAGSGASDASDVWASRDLETWELRNPGGSFESRGSLATAVLGDTVFVVGGINYANATWTHFSDTWSSSDAGRTWSALDSPPWHARGGHSVVALESGVLVLTGGAFFAGEAHEERLFSDVWTSRDEGRTWQLMTDSAPWGPRGYHRTLAIKDRVVLLGGFNGSYLNDMWESSDLGASWTLVDSNPVWRGRETFGVALVNQPSPSLVVLGGSDYDAQIDFNDVWSLPISAQAVV